MKANLDKSLTGGQSVDQLVATETELMKKHSAAMGERIKEIGFSERGAFFDFGGVARKWKYVNSTLHTKLLLEGIAVSGVALGVLLTMTDNKWLGERFSHNKNKDDRAL